MHTSKYNSVGHPHTYVINHYTYVQSTATVRPFSSSLLIYINGYKASYKVNNKNRKKLGIDYAY